MLELKGSTDSLTKDWNIWIKRVFEYSKLEAKSKATIREILSESKAIKEGLSKEGNFDSRHNYINMQFCLLLPFSPIDHDGVYALHLLSSLLSGKKATNIKLLHQFQVSNNFFSHPHVFKGTVGQK